MAVKSVVIAPLFWYFVSGTLCLLSFFLSLARGLLILLIFSKNQLLVLLTILPVLYFIDLYSNFYDFFSSVNFRIKLLSVSGFLVTDLCFLLF